MTPCALWGLGSIAQELSAGIVYSLRGSPEFLVRELLSTVDFGGVVPHIIYGGGGSGGGGGGGIAPLAATMDV